MNGLEEIRKIIENFVYESNETKKQITEIESRRTVLAQERNNKKKNNANDYIAEINVLGQKISELGNKSQELQNKLDFKFNEIKKIVNLTIDNLITDEIRNIRKIDEEKQELESKILNQTGKDAKYEVRKQEFFERFGRVPELSVKAQMKEKIQEKQTISYKLKIEELEKSIEDKENELVEFAAIKRNFNNKKWNYILEKQEDIKNKEIIEEAIELPLMEEFQVEEIEPIEYMNVKEFEPIPNVEIGEIDIEQANKIDENREQNPIAVIEKQEQTDEIEMLARAIVEEIIAEQTKDVSNSYEQEIIGYEDLTKNKSVITKLKKEVITLSNIIAKVEDGEIIYKALASNGEEIKVYPTLEVKNILLNEKEYKKEIKELLINYTIAEHKVFEYGVINKIDPTICEILERFAKKYNFDERNLIYNYAMAFSRKGYNEIDTVIPITYNLSYLKNTNLSNREKKIISKICKNASINENIDIIGGIAGFGKIKYIFKRIFHFNNINALPDGKCE